MLGVLRVGEGEDGAELAPQPGLGDLDALVADARAAGVDARLSIEGACRALSPTVDLSAYRIAQEALTNVVRHAGAARAEITLRYGPAQVELRVEDDGGTPPRTAGTVTTAGADGHGLVGMRERVALFGGSLETHPRRDGPGYVVHAVLPLEGLA
jgi:signal transduction histidine kinase